MQIIAGFIMVVVVAILGCNMVIRDYDFMYEDDEYENRKGE